MKKKLTIFTVLFALFMTSCNSELDPTSSKSEIDGISSSSEIDGTSSSSEREKVDLSAIETIATKRVWAKFTNESWLNDSGQLFITYRAESEELIRAPGAPMVYDAHNEAFYFDLDESVTHFTFMRTDILDNYYEAKTAELSYEDADEHIYTIKNVPISNKEVIVRGEFTPFVPTSTTVVEELLSAALAVSDATAALKVVNRYYHDLATIERALFDVTESDGETGAALIASLISTYKIDQLNKRDIEALVKSAASELTMESEITEKLTVPVISTNGAAISWESSNTRFIRIFKSDLRVTSADGRKVTLTATVKYLNYTEERTFNVTVELKEPATTLTVTWLVKLPIPIPSGRTLSIGSSLNEWTPSNTAWLDEVVALSDTEYAVTKIFPVEEDAEELTISYKWVLYGESDASDQWYGVELYGGNRTRKVPYRYENIRFNDTVGEWENIFGEEGGVSTKPLGDGTLDNTVINGRRVRIYKPSNYDPASSRRYPVIYMHDGQNLFEAATSFAGEWEIDETIEKIMREHNWDGAIAVGIDNTANRMGEYMYPTGYITYGSTAPVGDEYMDLIVNDIKPFIDENYRTLSDREHTYLAGSSMGGLISFFGGLHHLETFGVIFAFSSSTQLVSSSATNIPATLTALDETLLAATKFFLYVGTAGDGNVNWPDEYAGYLLDAGVANANVKIHKGQGLGHNEPAWARNFPIALKWALGF